MLVSLLLQRLESVECVDLPLLPLTCSVPEHESLVLMMCVLTVATTERLNNSNIPRLPACHATGARAKPLLGHCLFLTAHKSKASTSRSTPENRFTTSPRKPPIRKGMRRNWAKTLVIRQPESQFSGMNHFFLKIYAPTVRSDVQKTQILCTVPTVCMSMIWQTKNVRTAKPRQL